MSWPEVHLALIIFFLKKCWTLVPPCCFQLAKRSGLRVAKKIILQLRGEET